MGIDESVLKRYCEDDSKKSINSLQEPDLISQFLEYIKLNQDFAKNSNAYELASVIRSYHFWYEKKEEDPPIFPVYPRDIFYVDLGGFNLRYEEGYMHSCLILKRFSGMVLVVPGSTKKYGKKNFLIEPVQAGDGFKSDTGVMIDQLRCVSTTRIRGKKIGQVSPETFQRINDKILRAYFTEKFEELTKLVEDNKDLKNENEALKLQIEEHIEKIKILQEQTNNGSNTNNNKG